MADINNWNGSGNSTGLTNIVEIQNGVNTASSLVPTSVSDNSNFNFTETSISSIILMKKGKK